MVKELSRNAVQYHPIHSNKCSIVMKIKAGDEYTVTHGILAPQELVDLPMYP